MVQHRQEEENDPLQAEILREVAEEIKEEQIKNLWRKIGPYVTGVIAVVLLATGAFEFYRYSEHQKALQASEQLQTALTLIEAGEREDGMEILKTLKDSGQKGYHYLAALQYADQLYAGNAEDKKAALDILGTLAADEKAPSAIRNLSLFNKISVEAASENPNYAQMESALAPMIEADTVWTPLAMEIAAGLALRQNDIEKAKIYWNKILNMPEVSEEKRRQISEYLTFVKTEKLK